MKEKEFERWRKTREKGIYHYVSISGVIGWGFPMFIIMTFILNKHGQGFTSKALIYNIFIWAGGGLFFGFATWFTNEYRFKKALKLSGREGK